jgi:alkylresorcinol/alkylpyrone synthase
VTMFPRICGTSAVLPEHRYDQKALAAVAARLLSSPTTAPGVVERLFARVGVSERYLALEADAYERLSGFGARNDAWIAAALSLGAEAVERALEDAGVSASDVDMLLTTTVTGIAVPSIDARLMNRLPFRSDLKRIPLFGLGCVAGAAGIARATDYLRGHPEDIAVVLSVELCSLTVQPDDASVANIIATGLFGDGAAAVVLAGSECHVAPRSTVRVIDSVSCFFPDTERVMGWDVGDRGFKIVLSPEVPTLAREGLPPLIDALLTRHGLSRADVTSWIAHPGGPAVMAAMVDGLELSPDALAETRRSLAEVGNLSSASVLFLLDDFRKRVCPPAGSYAVLLAMGPAFSAEAVLLQW